MAKKKKQEEKDVGLANTTVCLKEDTKEFLDSVKSAFNLKTYDNAVNFALEHAKFPKPPKTRFG